MGLFFLDPRFTQFANLAGLIFSDGTDGTVERFLRFWPTVAL